MPWIFWGPKWHILLVNTTIQVEVCFTGESCDIHNQDWPPVVVCTPLPPQKHNTSLFHVLTMAVSAAVCMETMKSHQDRFSMLWWLRSQSVAHICWTYYYFLIFIVHSVVCHSRKIQMGQSTQQIIETKMNYILQYQHSFIGADVNATCFNLSLSHLQAYMKQQWQVFWICHRINMDP
jgi:hypothetical protein